MNLPQVTNLREVWNLFLKKKKGYALCIALMVVQPSSSPRHPYLSHT
jgi:hypothetical protein